METSLILGASSRTFQGQKSAWFKPKYQLLYLFCSRTAILAPSTAVCLKDPQTVHTFAPSQLPANLNRVFGALGHLGQAGSPRPGLRKPHPH